jgi:mono/diheme cytochrome c family protein
MGLASLSVGGCGPEEANDAARRAASLGAAPAEHRRGESLYEVQCARCHGRAASGTTVGPPLAHRIYEPSHHADAAFHLAVRRGVAAHHWRFGDMPAQPQVPEGDVGAIVGYVRWVQREVGIR